MIIVNLNVMMAKRRISVGELARRLGINESNVTILKNGRSRSVKIHTLNKLCYILDCEPADILEFKKVDGEDWMKEPEWGPEKEDK